MWLAPGCYRCWRDTGAMPTSRRCAQTACWTGVARFLRGLAKAAEQLTNGERWARILAHAVRSWLGGRPLRTPPRLMAPA
jgi:hypothetical protein